LISCRCPRRLAPPAPARPEHAKDPSLFRGTGPSRGATRLHRRQVHHQGPLDDPGYGGYLIRQGAYDLRKLREEPCCQARTRRYHAPPGAARAITALLTLRDQGIAPILAGIRSSRRRKPAHWTVTDRHYEILRIGMQVIFHDLGITPIAATTT
jgi:hypothetical protein